MHILNSCVVYQVSNCQPWMLTILAAHLFCLIAVWWNIHAAWCLCSCELRWCV